MSFRDMRRRAASDSQSASAAAPCTAQGACDATDDARGQEAAEAFLDSALGAKKPYGEAGKPGAAADAAPAGCPADDMRDMLEPADRSGDESDPALLAAADATFSSKVTLPIKIGIGVALVAAFILSMMLGKYTMTPGEVVSATGSYLAKLSAYIGMCIQDPGYLQFDLNLTNEERVIAHIRLPRVLVVMMVGAGLAIAGASYQGMFKNPLTSPDLLGASSGAALGACIALLIDMPGFWVQIFAFLGGIIAVGMAVWLNRFVDYDPTLGLVLAGILVSTLFESGMSLVKFMADADDKLPTITFWLMGSFHDVNGGDFFLCLIPMVLGFAILVSQSWKLNVLSFGDEEARAMGIDTARTRLLVIFAATLITSASVAVAGIVGWIGLVIPHLARAIVGPNYKVLLPTSMFVGAVYLLLVDDLARMLTTVEVPIGILTAILGVPFFVFIFKHNMKGWS